MSSKIFYETPVVVVGGGPVGMLTALNLSRLGVQCVLAEQNIETTKWPKMDLTNCRSMEIFRLMGIADEYRGLKGTVGGDFKMDTIFYDTFNAGGRVLARWDLPSINEWTTAIAEANDGTQPAEAGQRCTQIILEAWLKTKCVAEPLIESYWGWKYITHLETSTGVVSIFIDEEGVERVVRSKYLVGADGGSSRVRKTTGIKMLGSPLPFKLFLVHFRSADLAKKRPFGRFWHMMSPIAGFVIDQDEGDTFTVHKVLDSLDQDTTKIDPSEWIYSVFGGVGEPYRFKIDKILISSPWTFNFAIAEHYLSPGGRVILCGDAAHRNPPHGGYGMNSGVEDALGISWRLSAIIKGYGGPHLLKSYEDEQRPTMLKRQQRCFEHAAPFNHLWGSYSTLAPDFNADNEKGAAMRAKMKAELEAFGSECLDRGIELDARYKSAVIYLTSSDGPEPEWQLKKYEPSTYPGSRVPHVFLKDGKTSTYDTLGADWSLVTFAASGEESKSPESFVAAAVELGMPIKSVIITDEDHAGKVWGSKHVLVRADTHAAWRGNEIPSSKEDIFSILKVVTGHEVCNGYVHKAAVSELEILRQDYPENFGPVGVGEKADVPIAVL